MPDPPIKPPNKRADELTTQITFETFEKFSHIRMINERNTAMIDDLGKRLAFALAKIEIYEK